MEYRQPATPVAANDNAADFAAVQSELAKLQSVVAAAKSTAEFAKAEIARIRNAHVTGPGHSGTVGNGMMFDPAAAGASDGGLVPPPGTFGNPYIMGTNNAATYPDAAATDTWSLASGPSPSGGGPYDGVAVGAGFGANACAIARIFDQGDGKHFTFFSRNLVFNSKGAIVTVSVETGINFTVSP